MENDLVLSNRRKHTLSALICFTEDDRAKLRYFAELPTGKCGLFKCEAAWGLTGRQMQRQEPANQDQENMNGAGEQADILAPNCMVRDRWKVVSSCKLPFSIVREPGSSCFRECALTYACFKAQLL